MRLLLSCSISLILCVSSLAGEVPRAADLILIHARIYTANSAHIWAEALAIREGKLLAVGTDKEIEQYRSPNTTVIDAKDRLVLPGFTDCHVHFLDGSFALRQIDLEDAKDLAEIQRRVKTYADAHPQDAWLLGRGWSYPLFPPTGLPNKKDLDAIIADRPVYLEGFDGHSWWANSKALESANITKDTPDPPGGAIVRDPNTGEPTGAIKEDAADAIVRRAIPDPGREAKLRALRAGLKHANELGITRVHVMGGVNPGEGDLNDAGLLEELRKDGELTVRFYLAYRVEPPRVTDEQIAEIERARERYHDDWIAAGGVKFFLDGVIETHTAAMLQPYSDDPSLSGQLLWDPEQYKNAVTKLDRRGIQVFTHAIGDRAIQTALDAYENAARINNTKDAWHRIEHIEDVAASDISRFGRLRVIASMQPLHAYPDDDTLKVWARNVGSERAQRGWAWRSIQAAGGVLAFGSDWPIVTLSPWPGLQNAVTRQSTEGEPEGGWIPAERLSIEDAIKGYTINAAYAGHREKSEGSLEAGKIADLIVVSQDLFKVDPARIRNTEVLLTMVGGKVVYSSSKF
ncbi:MAG TPA: amidohydrolase [Terriglobales bacterium]|nr:amidohydrolase [Terriglobales bacterium]